MKTYFLLCVVIATSSLIGYMIGYRIGVEQSDYDSAKYVKGITDATVDLMASNPVAAREFIDGANRTASKAKAVYEGSFWHFTLSSDGGSK